MSYNGSGTFVVNSSGQPVITGTVISSTAFNALTADLATGLSTCVTKDGQTATTVRVPFAFGINSTLATDATSATTGSIITAGGISMQKALWVGTTSRHVGATQFDAAITYGGVTLSNAVTGTGNMVLSASPTLTGTLTAATITASGAVTATAFIPSSATVPANGLYLPAANTIGLSANTTEVMRSTSTLTTFAGNVIFPSGLAAVTVGSGTAATDSRLLINGGSASGKGSDIAFAKASSNYGYLGSHSSVIGGTAAGFTLQTGSATPFEVYVNAGSTTADFKLDGTTGAATFASTIASGAITSTGALAVTDTTASTSTTTGSMKAAGGLGIAGRGNFGGLVIATQFATGKGINVGTLSAGVAKTILAIASDGIYYLAGSWNTPNIAFCLLYSTSGAHRIALQDDSSDITFSISGNDLQLTSTAGSGAGEFIYGYTRGAINS